MSHDNADHYFGFVRVTLEIGGQEHVLGSSVFNFDKPQTSAVYAASALKAWDEARDKSERTLRLFGMEGVIAEVKSRGAVS